MGGLPLRSIYFGIDLVDSGLVLCAGRSLPTGLLSVSPSICSSGAAVAKSFKKAFLSTGEIISAFDPLPYSYLISSLSSDKAGELNGLLVG